MDPKRSSIVHQLARLEQRIERGLGTVADAGLRRKTYLELLCVLNGSGRFELIPARFSDTGKLTQQIEQRLNGPSGHALPRAIYESSVYRRAPETIFADGVVEPALWQYVDRLARSLRLSPGHGQRFLRPAPEWMRDVDESRQQMRVWIRELALQDMLLAAMESYLVPAGSGKPSTEIYGIVFGTQRRGHAVTGGSSSVVHDLNVERVCIQHRARGSPSEVTADSRSELTQLAMADELFPYWELLGDFHTHPYRTLAELTQQRGWDYSTYDEQANIEWCQRLRDGGLRPRVALILAITRAGRRTSHATECWNGLPHVLRTNIGRCHCFIAAYRIGRDGRYSTRNIALKCPHLVGQQSRRRAV